MKRQDYVVGFLFSPDRKMVALIQKIKPAWQAGKLNGIGGKIEPDERPAAAMVREFHEEAGVREHSWRMFCTIHLPDEGILYCFETTGDHSLLRSVTDELVQVVEVARLTDYPQVLPNLRWLIPLACDHRTIKTHAQI